ncbi:hypothetical protein A0J48_005310 [Sphaerospermopsis aphanizomenoides BCCUSP55]|uniref:DUF5331 domain-containing protein n=1 Tax=Sphaerospermopsis aphanizomenoides TaxID=459663 RepID=UPI0019058ADC|nr:DUF5331 domain-containing protein [Sphaerospermopsis aphanizomenoides]MBK1986964.1 hypothetical protein [Sphaerospermopsis aphanizomenoides BCCUSP55]
MNIQQLRQSLKLKWLSYCEENRSWLVKMRIWRSYDDGVRRPSSGYILATLSVLEPQLKQILPFILDLNNNPDQIVVALGLHFNPDEELRLLKLERSQAKNQIVSKPPAKILPENIPITPRDCDSAVKTVGSQQSPSPLPQENKQVLLRITPDVEQKRQSVSVVAVATPVHHHSSAKPLSQIGETPKRSDKTLRRPEVVKPGRSLTITTEVPTHNKELNHNRKFTTIPVPEFSRMSPDSNARSLPSWIDEFCPGIK